ncbi:MAG: hypothetical protein RI964_800 [Pseudomonadota bacterium]|jgi:hypothetical protein
MLIDKDLRQLPNLATLPVASGYPRCFAVYNNVPVFSDGSTWHFLWYSGGDGSGSGLDADLLDGLDSSAFQVAATTTITDWNSAVANGAWRGNAAANAPTATGWYMGFVQAHTASYLTQILHAFVADGANGESRLWRRDCNAGTWGAWLPCVQTKFDADTQSYMVTTGTTPAFTATPQLPVTSYYDGLRYTLRFHAAASAAVTLAVSGLAAIPLKKLVGSSYVAVTSIPSGAVVNVVYSGGSFIVMGGL